MSRIVETDNADGDYPDEHFLNLPPMSNVYVTAIADIINAGHSGPTAPRFPGFEP